MNIKEMMQLLDIKDVSTARQKKNGTVEWELPIKAEWSKRKIRVASFASGYVRCQLSDAYCSYQLNKRCQSEPQYFKLSNGDYRKFETRSCVLIPNEQDRLEYLISYCLKNYYIKNANQVADGKYIPKWKYDNLADAARLDCERQDPEVKVIVNGHRYNVSEWFK
tara:strand:- start:43 stop:537 length:495 start_codon:yes stop_codon:yes gene_type:complete